MKITYMENDVKKTSELDIDLLIQAIMAQAADLEQKGEAKYLVLNKSLYTALYKKTKSETREGKSTTFTIDKHARMNLHYILVLSSNILQLDDFMLV